MFKNKIDYWMEMKGLKNKHAARVCGVSEQTFSKWRQNKTQPDLEKAFALASLFAIPLDELGEQEENDK